jgi:Pentapeptide repeats (8 copies)
MLHKKVFVTITALLLAFFLFGFGFYSNYESLFYIGGCLIVFIICYLVFWGIPKYQVKELDKKSSGRKFTPFEREEKRLKLEDDARKTIAQIVGGALIFLGLFLTYSTYHLGVQKQDLDRRGQITERFNKAVEHLGNQDLAIRLGGLYALEQILKDSPEEHQTIIEVLSAYIRDKSKNKVINQPENNQSNTAKPTPEQVEVITTDVQTALTILGRRPTGKDRKEDKINLENVSLIYANLTKGNFANANLKNTNLSYANLTEIKLNRGELTGANFSFANLSNADLSFANLDWAIFRNANLFATNLNDAHFASVQLGNVKFLLASELERASFDVINYTYADNNGNINVLSSLNREDALKIASEKEKIHLDFQNSIQNQKLQVK